MIKVNDKSNKGVRDSTKYLFPLNNYISYPNKVFQVNRRYCCMKIP